MITMPITERQIQGPEVNTQFAWEPTETHRRRAQVNHGQSLETLAQRGGLSWEELRLILLDLPWSSPAVTQMEAKARCLELVPQVT